MPEAKKADKPDEEAVAATSRQYAGTSAPGEPLTARQLTMEARVGDVLNPIDFADPESGEVSVDDLPAVPPAGMFMAAEDCCEESRLPGPGEAAAEEPKKATASKSAG
jgi:hypothetical protein